MKVIIFQPALPNYRIDFFNRINNSQNLELDVYFSDASLGILTKSKKKYTWAHKIGNLIQILPGLYWQFGALAINISKSDCVVVCGAPRNLTTILILLKAKFRNIKTVWWGQYWSSTSKKYRQRIRLVISKLSTSLLFYTDLEVNKFKKEGWISNQQIGALNNGIDISEIAKKRIKYVAKERSLNVLFIGRITKKANLELLIDAFKILNSSKYKLDIIGEGPLLNKLREKVDILEIKHLVNFHGAMKDENKISKIANNTSIFIYPGSVGLSLIHAMAYGLPAIVHDNEYHHMPEIAAFKNNLTGMFFKENSAQNLSSTLVELMKSETLREKMSLNSLKTLEKNFNTENMSFRFLEFLNNLT